MGCNGHTEQGGRGGGALKLCGNKKGDRCEVVFG
jgi:hypothetical protein